ncbi:YkvA family protein [Sphingomicrobium sp. XHP0239]|uniref:YkvA family protein n=1 Tax=Sphingomicrobium maritimum TaxID=3133972 RepID=UPI0031CC99D9
MTGSRSVTDCWRGWARRFKADALLVWLAARDPAVPKGAKLLAFLTAAYAFSPVDLIPDFIPVLGLLDDLVIVPLGVWLTLRRIPEGQVSRLRREAAALAEKPVSWIGLAAVVACWILIALWVWRVLV